MARPIREIASSWTSSVKLYSNPTIECLERFDSADEVSSRISGKSCRSGKWSWLVRGSALEVVDTSTGQRLSAWRFGWSATKKLPYSISCVEEFPFSDGLYLVVGLKSTTASSTGMVCLFDPVLSRVVKAIEVPLAVTNVESLMTSGGVNAPQHAVSGQLRLMFGLIAVGTECGHVYLIDMRLDDKVEEFDEWNPSHLQIVDPRNANIANLRTAAKTDGAHIAFELGAECHMFGSFSYASQDGEILANFSSSDVYVTSLKYIRQLASLIVGYSFGCFQIWNLEEHCREFSSSVDVYSLPVTHIVYQEPENDPRLCCYLWIARGQTGNEEIVDSPTTITLYQVVYDRKESLPGYGRVLKDFSACGGRFEHQLTGDPYHLADATSCGSKVLCFYALERDEAAIDVTRLDDNADDSVTRDLTLVACVWEAPAPELHSSPTCHLAVFDINRWYHSQMPATIRDAMYGSKDPTCPFFAVCSLAETLDAGSPDALIDVLVKTNEIWRFSSTYGSTPEQFFWASSLSFDIISLMETGIVQAKYHGTQQGVLNDLKEKGVAALSEANEYFHRCWTAMLIPRNFNLSRAQEKSFQVEALLSVALEHNQPSFIISCIKKLGEDNVTYAGCNLRVILEWAWDQVIQIKEHLDQLCVPLFDGTGIFVDKQLIAMLDHYSVQLGNLVIIFEHLSFAAPTTDQGLKELDSQYTVTYLLNQYLQVVLFFMKQQLLPELFDNNEDGELSSQYYPGEVLAREYGVRRRELEQLNNDSLGGLMIDRVVSLVTADLGLNLWETESHWPELYPPPNLHALSSLILHEKINPTSKLCIIYYSLLDLCSLNPQFRTKKVAEKFAATFGLEPLFTNLFHGFWCLDHKDFEGALKLLTESVNELEIAPWQNTHIIRLLLNQEEEKKALLFIRSVKAGMDTPAAVELHLSVLINNALVTEAFQFQRHCRDPVRRQHLLEHFFHGCHQTKNINKILELPLNKMEEEHLVKYLEDSPFPHARELLVMFYLQRGCYVQAIRLNERLKEDLMNECDPAAQRRASVRNVIAEKYFELLPKVQQDLALRAEQPVKQKTKHREVPRPKPLSTVVNHKVHPRLVSQTAVVNAALKKIAEARIEENDSPKDTPFIGTPSTRRTKSLLSDIQSVSFPRNPQDEQPTTSAAPVRPLRVSPQESLMFSPVSSVLRKERARKLFKGANALSLLQTPPVTKHLSFAATPNPKDPHKSIATPQSILKPTRITRRSPSPSIISPSLPPRVRRVSGDRVPWMQDGISDNEESESVTHKKQIRFKSPSPSSFSAAEVFTYGRATVDRIPEEEDVMETETGSLVGESSESGLESDHGMEMQPSTSGKLSQVDEDVGTENDDRDTRVITVVDEDEDIENEQEVLSNSPEPLKLELSDEEDDQVVTMDDSDHSDLRVMAVVYLDEDNLDDDENVMGDESNKNEDEIIRPSLIDPKEFMNTRNSHQGETSTHGEAEETSSPPTSTNADSLPASPTPVSPATPPMTVSPTTPPTAVPPATPPTVTLATTTPERNFMPLREDSAVIVHPQPHMVQPSPKHVSPFRHSEPETSEDAYEERHSPASTFPGTPQVATSELLDSSRLSPQDGRAQSSSASRVSPSSPLNSSDEGTITSRASPPETRAYTSRSPGITRTSPAKKKGSPLRPSAQATPISERSTAVSTMTPPLSPPTKTEPSASGTSVFPQIFLDDINSPQPTPRTPTRPERRQSRSPSRPTPTRTSPPLTRSSIRRRSSRLNTPHQSPTDSPISFVTPVAKTNTTPQRKSPSQRKPVNLASHGMTLRARSCTNRTTRCGKLPHTH